MNDESSNENIHAEVSRSYTRALERSLEGEREAGAQAGICCAPTCCGTKSAATRPAGNAAKLVDYETEAEGLPEQALASSFGCGNPLAFSRVQAGETVVDLGSGAGLDLLIASRKVGPSGRVIGVDMTEAMIAEARRNVQRAGATNIELRQGQIEALPLEADSADWVISNCVINLSPDKPAVFRELARVLKPGGRVSISDLVAEDLPPALREEATLRSACIGGAISESEYIAGLQAAGLVDVQVSERIVYEPEQLLSILSLDHESQHEEPGEGPSRRELEEAVQQVTGKVWSAKFAARAPQ